MTEAEQDFAEEVELAGDKEIGSVRDILRKMQTLAKNVQTESKMSLLRQEGHNEDMLSNANWYFYAMMIEFSLFLGIMWFQ